MFIDNVIAELASKSWWDWTTLGIGLLGAIGGAIWVIEKSKRWIARNFSARTVRNLSRQIKLFDTRMEFSLSAKENPNATLAVLIKNLSTLIIFCTLGIIISASISFPENLIVSFIFMIFAFNVFEKIVSRAEDMKPDNYYLDKLSNSIESSINSIEGKSSGLSDLDKDFFLKTKQEWKLVKEKYTPVPPPPSLDTEETSHTLNAGDLEDPPSSYSRLAIYIAERLVKGLF